MTYTFKEEKKIDKIALKSLYEDVEWHAYTRDLDGLAEALTHSLYVLSVWDNEELIGLVRVVGDGLTIIYIQDILVLSSRQNQGIASEMMRLVLEKYRDVRQGPSGCVRQTGLNGFLYKLKKSRAGDFHLHGILLFRTWFFAFRLRKASIYLIAPI